MLRTILSSINDAFDSETKLVKEKTVYLLADLLAGCWLSGGFRWQECFGMSTTLKDEYSIAALFLQSTRLVFEHVLMLKELPAPKQINGFLVGKLNEFIRAEKDSVLRFYTRLVDIDVDSMVKVPAPAFYLKSNYFQNERDLFEIIIIRKKDLLQLVELVKANFDHFEKVDLMAEKLLTLTMYADKYQTFIDDLGHPLYRVQKSKR